MIIKLPIPFIPYARHKEVKIVKPLTYKDRLVADRIAMVVLLVMTIVGAIVAS